MVTKMTIEKQDIKNVSNMIINLFHAIGGDSGFKQDVIVKWLESYETLRKHGQSPTQIVSDIIWYEDNTYYNE